MKHLIKKNRWECLLYSFAMALDTTPELLISLIGHDGSKVIDPSAPEPHGRAGFHVQELITVVLALGRSCTPLQVLPASNVNGIEYKLYDNVARRAHLIAQLLHDEKGVIISRKHAMAFCWGEVFDPDGGTPFTLPSKDKVEAIFTELAYRRSPLQEVWVIR